ncbi:MAG: hypothetical protein F8N36_06950 [Desulfovibrio sp.]|nr:hypothetical protein [Desulfovibrio sp.]
MLKPCAVCLTALLAFAPSMGQAAGIVLKNSMNADIKSVFCVGNNGERLSVVEGLPKKSSKTVAAAKFPEHSCTRIGVTMQNGAGWQYYHEPEPGSAREIEFSLDSAGQHDTRKYPSMLITLPGNDAYVAPAGVPMFIFTQLMSKGMDQTRWKEFALPGYESLKEPGTYAVCFADQSWNIGQGGLKFSGKGGTLETVSMSAPFANTTLGAAFDDLKKNGWLPLTLEANGQTSVFNPEGAAMAPQETGADCPQTSDALWQAFETQFVSSTESTDKPVRLVLAREGLTLAINLNLDTALAEITLAQAPVVTAKQ